MKELTAVIDGKPVRFGYKDQFGHNYTLQQLNRKMKSGVKLINAVITESIITREPKLRDPYSTAPYYSYYDPKMNASIELEGYLL